jgi:hypothetical protein
MMIVVEFVSKQPTHFSNQSNYIRYSTSVILTSIDRAFNTDPCAPSPIRDITSYLSIITFDKLLLSLTVAHSNHYLNSIGLVKIVVCSLLSNNNNMMSKCD